MSPWLPVTAAIFQWLEGLKATTHVVLTIQEVLYVVDPVASCWRVDVAHSVRQVHTGWKFGSEVIQEVVESQVSGR